VAVDFRPLKEMAASLVGSRLQARELGVYLDYISSRSGDDSTPPPFLERNPFMVLFRSKHLHRPARKGAAARGNFRTPYFTKWVPYESWFAEHAAGHETGAEKILKGGIGSPAAVNSTLELMANGLNR